MSSYTVWMRRTSFYWISVEFVYFMTVLTKKSTFFMRRLAVLFSSFQGIWSFNSNSAQKCPSYTGWMRHICVYSLTYSAKKNVTNQLSLSLLKWHKSFLAAAPHSLLTLSEFPVCTPLTKNVFSEFSHLGWRTATERQTVKERERETLLEVQWARQRSRTKTDRQLKKNTGPTRMSARSRMSAGHLHENTKSGG